MNVTTNIAKQNTEASDQREALISALQCTSMVITLSMSMWSPIRVDRELANDVAAARSSRSKAFSVRKNIFDGADEHIKVIAAIQADFRRYYYMVTLPFGIATGPNDRGPRLLSNDNFFEFCQRISEARSAMNAALADLEASYSECIEIAKENLADAYDETDYPDVADLRKLFAIDFDPTPVPDGAGFRGLAASTLDELAGFVNRKLEKKAAAATADLVTRVTDYMTRLTTRIDAIDETIDVEGKRKATVRKSLFDEAEAIAGLVEAFPFANDERMQTAVALLREVANHDADSMKDAATRSALKARATEVWDCFNDPA